MSPADAVWVVLPFSFSVRPLEAISRDLFPVLVSLLPRQLDTVAHFCDFSASV